MEREAMEFDVVIVGGGPAGLASAIRLKQMAAEKGSEISVCLIEKGAEIGAHILSGAVMDPRALNELLPELEGRRRAAQCAGQRRPLLHPLRKRRATGFPTACCPDCFHNEGNYVISLGNVCRWLGEQAEALGVEIYPGFAGAEVLFNDDGAVKGVATGDMGRLHDGSEGPDLPARHGTARQIHLLRRRLPRPPRQAADGAIQPERRRRPADLRHRPQGTVGNQAGEAPARPRRPYRRLADGSRHLRRRFPLPPGKQPGRRRLRRRPRLQQSVPVAVRGIPALQDASGNPQVPRRRQAHRLRRPRPDRRRPPVAAQADFPGRRAGRRRCRLPQRRAHQGLALRDQVRHAGRREPVSRRSLPSASTTN